MHGAEASGAKPVSAGNSVNAVLPALESTRTGQPWRKASIASAIRRAGEVGSSLRDRTR
jgi:hypothetical protein